MSTISSYRFVCTDYYCISSSLSYRSTISRISTSCPSLLNEFLWCPHPLSSSRTRRRRAVVLAKSSEGSEVSTTKDEWLKRLPDKNKPLYAHSLPCIEAWLKSLGFYQSKDDRALWFVEKPDWHAQLSLDVTDLYIRFVPSDSNFDYLFFLKVLTAFGSRICYYY